MRNPLIFSTDATLTRRDFAKISAALGLTALSGRGLASVGSRGASLVVDTHCGKLRGSRAEGSIVFLGVPYGDDTSGRRFQCAAAPRPWAGIRDANEPGLRCPQSSSDSSVAPPGSLLASWSSPQRSGEDCLRLNIWTSSLGEGRRPVMVWLHGGGFDGGSGSEQAYNGARLASRHGVVFVSVTHRLNVFGHLYLRELGGDDGADSGNVGMLDVVLALEWIRDNIDRFGGDPNNVTIFGQSGGGGKVTALLSMPAAKGLFHRAIVQSCSTGIGARTPQAATEDAIAYMDGLGLNPRQVDKLRVLPVERLREGLEILKHRRVGNDYPWGDWSLGGSWTEREWRPVLDGRVLMEHPFYPHAPAVSADVPLLIGTAKDECRLHLGLADPHSFEIDWEQLNPRLKGAMRRDPTAAIGFYREQFHELPASDLLFKIFTFWRWRHSTIWQTERKCEQGGAPTYLYRVDWETPVDGGKWKALHAIELPFVFDNIAGSASLLGNAPTAQRMADTMSEVWTTFAKTGKPVTERIPAWPVYNLESRAMLTFDITNGLHYDLESVERKFFADSLPRMPL